MNSSISLTVELVEFPGAEPSLRRLEADGSGPLPPSTVADPAAALAAVLEHGEALFFPPPHRLRMCTQQYGGPQRARVTGVFHGRPVHAEFSLTDGCRISDWKRLAPLLGSTPGLL